MAITARLVKQLRDTTGAGMMNAKKALTATNGDIEAAIDWLRTKGLATAAKKSARIAAEGLVAIKINNGVGAIIEVNTETDFVGKNVIFRSLVLQIADKAIRANNLPDLLASHLADKTVKDAIIATIAQIGENISLRRMAKISGDMVVSYIHAGSGGTLGKIGVLVALRGKDQTFARQVAMHIAASNPQSLSEKDLNRQIIKREKMILSQQAHQLGKPEAIIQSIIKGRMKKFYSEVTLLNQAFVINPDITVGAAAQQAHVEITGFVRFEVGEGIKKKQKDLTIEVAKISASNLACKNN